MAGKPIVGRLALIGIGLIGSSLARAVKRGGLAGEIVCTARSARSRETALRLGIVDRVESDPAAAVAGADLVVLCTPLQSYEAITKSIAGALAPGAILSDVGSVKQHVLDSLGPLLPEGVHLVPGHPIAGTEESGPEAGFAELFDNRWCVLTPAEDCAPEALAKVSALWEAVGSRVEVMDARHHDRALALTSHLPHLIAYNIVGTASDLEAVTAQEVIKYSAGGFRDFTRIAASDPTMWRDVFLTNREAVLEVLSRFTEDLFALQRAIRWGDGDALFDLFTRTRAIRRQIVEAGQETAAPDFGRPHGDGGADE
ncbi:prephenate/arogenate dehydrogenase family protein [Oceanibacterium hippocampi]|uniref:prephenate dehydrogenase n=1 Tax=Oceanibacterium hippocampi TaxID=745714 RepID=A0A1Y5RVG8_9PROT|nr:prephenate/arogenate dehydrogenase family protein [Oceanibacterium hippocampi]SLN26332.1 cyclohexadienyl dehydrogenase [Oceanibacterium hippocampi]